MLVNMLKNKRFTPDGGRTYIDANVGDTIEVPQHIGELLQVSASAEEATATPAKADSYEAPAVEPVEDKQVKPKTRRRRSRKKASEE